jgi:hypothetical protein
MIFKTLKELGTKIKDAVFGDKKGPAARESTPSPGGHSSHQHHPKYRATAPNDGHWHMKFHRGRK